MSQRRTASSPPARAAAADAPDTRENQLLAIARSLFARDGYERTSMRDIAEVADITKAALYYYFPNKEALYERVVLESMQSLVDDVSAAVAAADSPTARIRAFMQSSADVFDLARDRWIAGSRAFREGGRGGQHLAAIALRDRYENLLRQCISEGIASGEVRAIDPAIAGRFLLSGLNQMTNWHRPDGRLGVTEVMRQFLDMALHGLLAEARPADTAAAGPPAARSAKA
ncbi:TetR/AcrR family transcriptional regulator [Variovorax ginsengisoli]|uniref:TetR/AcrR family transcriptional regulator n=1 Tax=Variovorax ginsengisoli TaxID=363844 RepID=A0ABT8S5R1_9BURK|nr:TetR/AcrR family transcriptional regulator [Variovorax ginsengisoli]MDN8615083.1 TetR/AcrR family transcriptional regulator [Variovorax ginsengisoli]MDO1534253.1 TetR/AcrR family transcriptional regulator [Variovorax ginsengisoli]